MEQLPKLLQKINLDRALAVLPEIIAALAVKTTLPENISALMSCAQEIAFTFK